MNPFAGCLGWQGWVDESPDERSLLRGNDLVILTSERSNGIVIGMEREVGNVIGLQTSRVNEACGTDGVVFGRYDVGRPVLLDVGDRIVERIDGSGMFRINLQGLYESLRINNGYVGNDDSAGRVEVRFPGTEPRGGYERDPSLCFPRIEPQAS